MDIVSQMVVDLLSDEKDTGKIVVDLSSDEEDSEKIVVDLSSDDEDENISWNFHSDLADKRKGADEMVSTTSRRHNTKGKRAESEVKKLEPTLIPGVSAVAAMPKDNRKRKTDEWAIITCSASKKSNEQTEVSVATYKKIPRVHVTAMERIPGVPLGSLMGLSRKMTPFHTHTSLVGKKVILYGLPGYVHYDEYDLWDWNMRGSVWAEFYLSRVVPPALEFVEQADVLKANGVDQILFIAVNANAMEAALSLKRRGWPGFPSWYPYVRVLWDSKYHNPKLRSFYRGLQLGPDICEGWIPPRCRRYFFLLDDNKVIYSNIETSDQIFIPPSAEEIIQAFNG